MIVIQSYMRTNDPTYCRYFNLSDSFAVYDAVVYVLIDTLVWENMMYLLVVIGFEPTFSNCKSTLIFGAFCLLFLC